MKRSLLWAAVAASLAFSSPPSWGGDDLSALRAEIEKLRREYEARIAALEERLARREAAQPQEATPPVPRATATAFNPQISLILSGTYANTQRDPENYRIEGFIPSGAEVGPGVRSFSLRESELALSANVDPYFRGELLAALADEGVEVENAFVDTLALPQGLSLRAGRFYSGVGYINERHPHAWDFVDAPLAQQAFLGTNFANDGLRLTWVAPTATYFVLGAEVGRGQNFPGAERNKNGIGGYTLFAKAGGDVGDSFSWLAGVGYRHDRPRERVFTLDGVDNAFGGRSRLWVASLVGKWAPDGNPAARNFKLQGEFYRRTEDGELTYDIGGSPNTDLYRARQSGAYLQGVYQFMPRWRMGLRLDRLDSGSLELAGNAGNLPGLAPFSPKRASAMLDYSPSEYSRLRLQFSRDEARRDEPDNQVMVQYTMSLGAHGAHRF